MPARTRLSAAFVRLPAPIRGALWMVTASAGFATMTGLIRHISAELHPFEIAFFRNAFGLVIMTPWLVHGGLGQLRTERIGLHAFRALLGLMAMMGWFWAITVMPLANAVALSFTVPLFATVLAVVVLGETVRARRWTATAVGFMGAMIILRPGIQEMSLASVLVLISSTLMAGAAITIKLLSRTDSPNAIVTYMVLFMTPLSALPALLVWRTPGWEALGWLAALGAAATLGHQCLTRAFAAAEASAVMPFDFARLVFAALIGYLAFGESADMWTWAGAAVIAGSSVYIAHRESRVTPTARAATEASAEHSGR